MKRGVSTVSTLLLLLFTLSTTWGYLRVNRQTFHQTRLYTTKSDQNNELQKVLRNFIASVAAFQVLSTSSLPADAVGSLNDAIFPATLPSTVSNIFVFKAAKPSDTSFLSEPLGSWKDFTIKLPEYKLGLNELPNPLAPKKWFIEGFDKVPTFSPTVSGITVLNSDGALSPVEGIRSFLQNGLSMMLQDWVPATSIIGLILIANAIKYADQLTKLLEKEVEEKQDLVEKLGVVSKESQDAIMLQRDILAMASQVDELKGALEAARLKEKYSQTSADDANKELSSTNHMIESMKSEIKSLREALSDSSAAIASANSAAADRLAAVQAREKRLVEAIKVFMLDQGFMSPAVAQMLLSQSAPEIIEKANANGVPSKKEKELEHEVASLKAQLAGLQKSGAWDNKSVKADADKYMKMLTSEVDDLKQKLLSSDERFMDLQREMQSKVDSAKAMAKELNARLETKDASKADSNSPEDSKSETIETKAPQVKSSTLLARLQVLKDMSPNQRKRMTKPELETEFKKLGLKKSDDGRLYSSMLKSELLIQLDKMLA